MTNKKIISSAVGIASIAVFSLICAQAEAADLSLATAIPAAVTLNKEQNVVPSQLLSATVFFNGAELNYSVSANLKKGENTLSIEGLSPTIDLNSLRIKVTDQVVVSSYEFSVDYLTETKSANAVVKQIEAAIETKTAELEKLAIDIKIYTEMRQLLSSGVTKNVSGSENGLGVEELKKAMDFYKQKSAELEAQLGALQKSQTTASEELVALQKQLAQETVKGKRTSGVLRLNLSSPKEGAVKFEVIYNTPSAGWSPYYDINIASTEKPFMLTTKSKVTQTTGIDWTNIRLTLSTATPSNGKTAPLFTAWTLRPIVHSIGELYGFRAPQLLQNSVSYEKMDESVALEEVVTDAEPAAPIMNDYVDVAGNALNVTYDIDLPYDIPGNGKVQNIDLQTKEVTAEYKYYCAPKLDNEVFVVAEVADWQKLGLMNAPANVTYDETNIGETYIDASSTHEKLSLTLGTDKRISVKRESLKDYSTKSTFGGNVTQEFTYRVTVKNNQNVPIKMVTKEQYPISSQKNIDVTLNEKKTTPWTANIKELGVITWEETIAPGQTKVYEISYSVKYPKDMDLNL